MSEKIIKDSAALLVKDNGKKIIIIADLHFEENDPKIWITKYIIPIKIACLSVGVKSNLISSHILVWEIVFFIIGCI